MAPTELMRGAPMTEPVRQRRSYDCKGRILTIRDGMTVVPYEQTRGGWYAVVLEATSEADQKSYPRGGYNIVVTDQDVEQALERTMTVPEHVLYGWACSCGWEAALGQSVFHAFDEHLREVGE